MENKIDLAKKRPYLCKLSAKEDLCGIVWMTIGILQIVSGIALAMSLSFAGIFPFLYALIIIVTGVTNCVFAISRFKTAEEILDCKVPDYKSQRVSIITRLFLNMFLGATIGVIGVAFDIAARHYALSHSYIFDELIKSSKKSDPVPEKTPGIINSPRAVTDPVVIAQAEEKGLCALVIRTQRGSTATEYTLLALDDMEKIKAYYGKDQVFYVEKGPHKILFDHYKEEVFDVNIEDHSFYKFRCDSRSVTQE